SMSKAGVFVLVCVALIMGAIAAALTYITTNGISARARPGAIETAVATRLRSMATPAGARERKNPLEATPLAVAEGRDHYADHCEPCHANNGSGHTEMGRNMYPPVPDMRGKETQSMTDGEIFYIIQQGVRFTGMPGWGGEDEDNWKLVLFIRHLPDLTGKELEFMKEINGQGPEL